MIPPRISPTRSTSAPFGSPFDHVTMLTFVVLAAVLFGVVVDMGPAEALQHLDAVLNSMPDALPAGFDPANWMTGP